MPVVHDLVTDGPARRQLTDASDDEVAKILRELDQLAARTFFDYSGWDSNDWGDDAAVAFLQRHA